MMETNDSEDQYHLYYRTGYQDHIAKNGKTICSSRVRQPSEDDLKPVEELTDRELKLLTSNTSNLCSQCRRHASQKEVFEDIPEGDIPKFPCPKCGEPAQTVSRAMGVGRVTHEDGTVHEIDFSTYQKWRRGDDIIS